MGHRIVDLDARDWEPWHPQFPGTRARTLYVDEGSGANLRQAFLPAGFSLDTPSRHHHGNTREGVFILFGNVCYREYTGPADTAGRLQDFREGFLLDRPPRSIHGPNIEAITELGCLILEWGSGPLSFNYIPFEGDLASHGTDFNPPHVADSRAMAWQEHPRAPGLKIKPLSTGGNAPLPGFHPVCLVHVPPGWQAADGRQCVAGDDGRRWLYVLHGDLPVTLAGAANSAGESAHLAQNHYLEWSAPTDLILGADGGSEIGAVVLCVGHDLA